jgi:hypothetical protein
MEELIAAMVPEEEEVDDLPVYCMNEGSTTFSRQEKMKGVTPG